MPEQRFHVVCEGITPLMMEAMPPDKVVEILIRKNAQPRGADDDLRDRAAEGLYLHPKTGEIGIPVENLFACIRDAGKLVKLPFDTAQKVTRADKSTYLTLFLTFEGLFYPIHFDENRAYAVTNWEAVQKSTPDAPVQMQLSHDFMVDTRRGRLKDGTACPIIRPLFESWWFEFNCIVDTGLVGESDVTGLITKGGKGMGLCSFRPSCGGNFGQFKIKKWQNLGVVESIL